MAHPWSNNIFTKNVNSIQNMENSLSSKIENKVFDKIKIIKNMFISSKETNKINSRKIYYRIFLEMANGS
jgi:hypothetical protein